MSFIMLAMLVWVGMVRAGCDDTLYVFQSSPTGYAGDLINLQGGTFSTGSSAWLSSSTFTNKPIKVVNEGPQLMTLQLPSYIAFDKYSIQFTSGGKLSSPVYINTAIVQHADALHVGNGSNFRIFGRNLYYSGKTPQVILKDSSGASYSCAVNTASSTAFVLSLTAPSTIKDNSTYTIWITNDLGGTVWSPLVSTGIYIIGTVATTDVYGLNVPWHGYFRNHKKNVVTLNPSGTLDDANMIRNALFSVAASGQPGEVYLSAGTYGLTGGIEIPSGIVLRGAGKSATTIVFNHKYNTMTGGAGWVWFPDNGVNFGIADLSFVNAGVYAVNGETNPLQIGRNTQRAFLKNIYWNANITKHLFFAGITESVVTDCEFIMKSTPAQNGNLWLGDGTFTVFKNNVVTYDTWGLHFLSAVGVVIDNNTIHRNAAVGFRFTTHVFAVSFTSNLYFANNKVDVVNGKLIDNNDGETLLTEGGGASRGDIGAGKVTSATFSTLSDSTQNWVVPFTTKAYVAITSGPGMGQHRRIVSNTPTTMTVDKPWDVVPTSVSTYSFGGVAANWTVYKNTFLGQERGIWIYMSYVYSLAIDSNTLTDSEGISLIAYTTDSNGAGSPIIATWTYDVQITNNILTWTPSNTADPRATLIGLNHDQVRADPVGIMVVGVEVKRNQIKYLGGGTRGEYNDDYSMYDGYFAKVTNQSPNPNPTLPNSVIGTIFQGNSISSYYAGFTFSEFVSQTTIASHTVVSCTNAFRNVTVNRNDRSYATDTNRATISSAYNLCF